MMISKQKTLNLNHMPEFTFSTYICPEKQPNILQPVYNFLASKDFDKTFYIWGPEGSGKSHILQSSANYTAKIGHKSFYTCLKNPKIIKPEVISNLENFDLICIDNIDHVLDLPEWQEAIYYCLELVDSNNTKIIVSGKKNIQETNVLRAESFSRLSASYRHQLIILNEAELFTAIVKRAKYRQISISNDVIKYLINFAPRDSKSIFKILNQISIYSLTEKKCINKKMVKDILQQYS